MSDSTDFHTDVPDGSEQLDQIQEADSLVDRGVEDVLDEGYIAPDGWSPAQGYGNTIEEMQEGETLEQRIKQEVPDRTPENDPWQPKDADRDPDSVSGERAGRLMQVQGPGKEGTLGVDVGFAGGAASAEEAAMHVVTEDDLDLLDDAPDDDDL